MHSKFEQHKNCFSEDFDDDDWSFAAFKIECSIDMFEIWSKEFLGPNSLCLRGPSVVSENLRQHIVYAWFEQHQEVDEWAPSLRMLCAGGAEQIRQVIHTAFYDYHASDVEWGEYARSLRESIRSIASSGFTVVQNGELWDLDNDDLWNKLADEESSFAWKHCMGEEEADEEEDEEEEDEENDDDDEEEPHIQCENCEHKFTDGDDVHISWGGSDDDHIGIDWNSHTERFEIEVELDGSCVEVEMECPNCGMTFTPEYLTDSNGTRVEVEFT